MHTILGINGTVGSYLAADLHRRNIPVRGVSRRPHPGPHWQHVQADALNLAEMLTATEGSETVYLVIGLQYDIKVWQRDWPIVMSNAIEACMAHGAKLVFLDNVYAYGLVKGEMTEETPYSPCSNKGLVRKELAQTLMDAVEKRGLRACIARSADFYGPQSDLSAITQTVIQRHKAGKKAMWTGDATKLHTFSYSCDLGPALAQLGVDSRADNQIWHLPSSAETWTGKDWIEASAKLYGAPTGYQQISTFMLRAIGLFNPVMREIAEMNYQFTHDYLFSSKKFEKVFGQKPTPYAEGLAETFRFYGK